MTRQLALPHKDMAAYFVNARCTRADQVTTTMCANTVRKRAVSRPTPGTCQAILRFMSTVNPSCSKCWSLVRIWVIASASIAFMDAQSWRLYSLSRRAS